MKPLPNQTCSFRPVNPLKKKKKKTMSYHVLPGGAGRRYPPLDGELSRPTDLAGRINSSRSCSRVKLLAEPRSCGAMMPASARFLGWNQGEVRWASLEL